MEDYHKKLKNFRLQKFIGNIIRGIGIVFLISAVFSVFSSGKIMMVPLIIGLVLYFLGNVLNKVGKNNEDKLLNG